MRIKILRVLNTILKHYNKAISLYPITIIYYNIAAVHYEQQNYTECILQCDLAIDISQRNMADIKLIQKARKRLQNTVLKGQWKLGSC